MSLNAPWDLPPGTPNTTYDHFAESPERPTAPPSRGARRRGILLAIVGLTLLFVVPVVWYWWAVNYGNPRASLASLEVGQCFRWWVAADLATDQKSTVVYRSDCAQMHDGELFANSPFIVPAPTTMGPEGYPGAAWLQANGAMACREFLPEYTADASLAARLVVMVAVPNVVEWKEGDQDSLCLAGFPTGPEAGSVRAANR